MFHQGNSLGSKFCNNASNLTYKVSLLAILESFEKKFSNFQDLIEILLPMPLEDDIPLSSHRLLLTLAILHVLGPLYKS